MVGKEKAKGKEARKGGSRRAHFWEKIRTNCREPAKDTVSEWLRRWTRNPLGSARKGLNPFGVDACRSHDLQGKCQDKCQEAQLVRPSLIRILPRHEQTNPKKLSKSVEAMQTHQRPCLKHFLLDFSFKIISQLSTHRTLLPTDSMLFEVGNDSAIFGQLVPMIEVIQLNIRKSKNIVLHDLVYNLTRSFIYIYNIMCVTLVHM